MLDPLREAGSRRKPPNEVNRFGSMAHQRWFSLFQPRRSDGRRAASDWLDGPFKDLRFGTGLDPVRPLAAEIWLPPLADFASLFPLAAGGGQADGQCTPARCCACMSWAQRRPFGMGRPPGATTALSGATGREALHSHSAVCWSPADEEITALNTTTVIVACYVGLYVCFFKFRNGQV